MARSLRGWPPLVPALALALVAAPPADAAVTSLTAGKQERGWISLTVRGDDGTNVDLSEAVGASDQHLATVTIEGGQAVVRHAARWRCDRYVRRFIAVYGDEPPLVQAARIVIVKSDPIRTPSCRHRLRIRAKLTGSGRTRHLVTRVVDTFGVGDLEPQLCPAAPGDRAFCRYVTMRPGQKARVVSYRVGTPGLWEIGLRTTWGQKALERVYVRPARPLRLLATGDSMIQILDLDLRDRLAGRGIRVRSDARVGTGISKPFLFDWTKHARRQARSRPDITVVFLGANDGFPIGGADCCGNTWVDAYAARARKMMEAYSRDRRGLVYWLTLPAPRPAQWRPIYPAVDRALKRAAASFDGRVRLIDLARVFTPGFRFRQSMVWHGRVETVRQPDGIHLTHAGTQIAESVIEAALRRDGVL